MREDKSEGTAVPYQKSNEITEIVVNKIVVAFNEMDIMELVSLLDEEIEYQDLGKWRFLALIKKQFKQYQKDGDSYLFEELSHCVGCSFGRFGYTFKGNHSQRKWSLVFKVENGALVDIYECNMFYRHHVEDKTEPTGDLPF